MRERERDRVAVCVCKRPREREREGPIRIGHSDTRLPMAKIINAWATEWTQRDAWAAGGTQREREGPIRIGHSDTRLPMAEYWMCIK